MYSPTCVCIGCGCVCASYNEWLEHRCRTHYPQFDARALIALTFDLATDNDTDREIAHEVGVALPHPYPTAPVLDLDDWLTEDDFVFGKQIGVEL